MKDGQSQVLRAFHDVQLTMLKSSASTTTSYDAKHSLIVNVAMSKMHTKESCDLLIECLTQKDADIFSITKCMQGCIIQGTLQQDWNGSPSYMPGLAHMWSAMLSPCSDGWGQEVVVAMMLTLLESINRICIETQDWCEPSQHYKVYEQLGVLGNMVRAAVQVLCTESEGRPSGGLQPESVAILVNTIGMCLCVVVWVSPDCALCALCLQPKWWTAPRTTRC
jgi:hypothetical protein